MTDKKAPKEAPKGLTEAQVRAIVQSELAKTQPAAKTDTATGDWKHDASHSADAVRLSAQQARDEAANLTPPEPEENQ